MCLQIKFQNTGVNHNILQSSHIFVAGLGMREKGYKKVGTHDLDIQGGGGLIQPFYNFCLLVSFHKKVFFQLISHFD